VKIIATSCWHLDLEHGGYDFHLDIIQAANEVIDASRGADLLVHLGDLFDTNRPSPRAYKTAMELFSEAGCPVLLIPGNHDSEALGPLEFLEGVEVQATPGMWAFERGKEYRVFLCVGHPPRDWDQEKIDELFRIARRSADALDTSVRVEAVFCHLEVEGSVLGGYVHRETQMGIPVKLAKKLPCPVVNGHIHGRQTIEPNIVMPGSLIRATFGERGESKGYYEFEV
jgi:DNA repair exonuclease SbcCD nuclease subunit